MTDEFKEFSSPLSSIKTETDVSFTNDTTSKRENLRRFTRSSSHSRSKSKEEPKQILGNNFFVKNVCREMLNESPKHVNAFTRVPKISNNKEKNCKREITPAKQRRLIEKSTRVDSSLQVSLQKELEYLKLERKYHETQAENQKLRMDNKQLSQKLSHLELQSAQSMNYLLQKIKFYEERENARISAKESKGNNLLKLKKQIAEVSCSEIVVSISGLQQQLNIFQSENKMLKDSLLQAQNKLCFIQDQSNKAMGERQMFLDQLVQQLKINLNQKDEIIARMRIQLNIFCVRQFKQCSKDEIIKTQEIMNLKRKYIKVLKRYHQVNQELAGYKRKQERVNYLFAVNNSAPRNSDSLSLSP